MSRLATLAEVILQMLHQIWSKKPGGQLLNHLPPAMPWKFWGAASSHMRRRHQCVSSWTRGRRASKHCCSTPQNDPLKKVNNGYVKCDAFPAVMESCFSALNENEQQPGWGSCWQWRSIPANPGKYQRWLATKRLRDRWCTVRGVTHLATLDFVCNTVWCMSSGIHLTIKV